jgi:stress-induced-phosphoprotein 1
MSSSQHAVQLKEAGNQFFKEKNYDAAIKKFSEAIALEPRNPTFYGNRAACFYFTAKWVIKSVRAAHELTQRYRFPQVITDCQMALQLDPRYAKAWLRKADAHDVSLSSVQTCDPPSHRLPGPHAICRECRIISTGSTLF